MGLIFLSAMASSIAGLCLDAGRDAATALGTSLLTMSVATFFTGAMTLLVGEHGRRAAGPLPAAHWPPASGLESRCWGLLQRSAPQCCQFAMSAALG